jgi:hypothetical protein
MPAEPETGVEIIGIGTYVYGLADQEEALDIATECGVVPQTMKLTGDPEINVEAKDTVGETAALALSRQKKLAFELSGYLEDAAKAEANPQFSFRGRFFIGMSFEISYDAANFAMGTIRGMSYPKISAPAAPAP